MKEHDKKQKYIATKETKNPTKKIKFTENGIIEVTLTYKKNKSIHHKDA